MKNRYKNCENKNSLSLSLGNLGSSFVFNLGRVLSFCHLIKLVKKYSTLYLV